MKETDDDDYGGGREQDPMMLAKGKRLGQPAASRGEASVRFVLPHITFLGGEDGEALIEPFQTIRPPVFQSFCIQC